MRLLLINPNISESVSALIADEARRSAASSASAPLSIATVCSRTYASAAAGSSARSFTASLCVITIVRPAARAMRFAASSLVKG